MRAFLAHDRLQLLFVVLGVATGTWRGLAVAALIGATIACRRVVRRRFVTWVAGPPAPGAHRGAAALTDGQPLGPRL